jgi:hypothetical protein
LAAGTTVAKRGAMRVTTAIALVSLVLSACAEGSLAPHEVEDGFAVPAGKEDDFYSLSAYEYVVEGRASVTLEPALAGAAADEREARVKELIGYQQIAVAWFLTQYFIEKKPDDSNAEFGGYGALAKGGAWEDLDVEQIDELTYEFSFRQLIAGRRDLMSRLPLSTGADGRPTFVLTIGTPTNAELAQLETDAEWYRRAPWSSWNPDAVSADRKRDLVLSIERERESTDAWFDYEALFADGELTIDVHFGWDYHNEYHVRHARSMFSWLRDRAGFTPPVATFDELRRDSGPFVRTLDANGREILVEVRLFYGKPGSETDPDTDAGGRALEDDMRASLASRDVIVYSGHSGPFYGFALANWRVTSEGDLDDSDMATVEMPAETYQIVFAEGCDTYHIGEAFKRNPAKPDGRYIDVITTTAASNAATPAAVQRLITRLIERDDQGRHQPRTLKSLLSDLDSGTFWFHTMYGIHGIDDNPAVHPYGELSNLCQPCSANAECGGVGNLCIGIGAEGSRHCAVACTDDRGCPDGYRCGAVASQSAGAIYASACVPQTYRCD